MSLYAYSASSVIPEHQLAVAAERARVAQERTPPAERGSAGSMRALLRALRIRRRSTVIAGDSAPAPS